MLIIKSFSYQITISDKDSYAIYSKDYYIDKEGNILTETDRFDVYQYGDIVIQTSSTQYIIKKVHEASEYVSEIIDYIKTHINDPVIYIDMNELNENWENYGGTLEIELLK